MITDARTQKMVVISDLHLGNPFCKTRPQVVRFLRWAAHEGYDICINGDGLEIAQVSFEKIALDVPDVFQALKQAAKHGRQTYYVVGNHDIALENFLSDWGALKVAPFLNLHSGPLRVRVEHGHLYDPFFVRSPRMYEICTHLAGYLLKISPSLYKVWIAFEKFKSRMRARRSGIVGEPPEFAEAATEVSDRGFDAVVFGHTHHPGVQTLANGAQYLNPGSWLLSFHYVEITPQGVQLKRWQA